MKKSLISAAVFVINLFSIANAQQSFVAAEVLPETSNVVSYNKWNPENKTLKIIYDSKGADVLWKTFSTINGSQFELQRADESGDFITIRQVQVNSAAGRNNYALGFRKTTVVEQQVSYRLKLVFRDGSVDYSDVAFVNAEDRKGVNGYLMLLR